MDAVRGGLPAAFADSGGSIRRLTRQVGWARLTATIFFLVIAILFARFGWSIPLAVDAERALYDVRALVTAPQVEQDPRIVMVVYTDRTLELTGKRSPLDRSLLAKALANIDRLGAKAIGIDILIDQPQPEDPELIRAFRGMKTPTYLGFASNATNANFMQVWQEEFLANFLKQLAPGNVHPTSIRLEADSDNVARSWPSQPAALPPLLPNAVAGDSAFRSYQGGIRYRLPADPERPVFNSLSIELFESPALADAMRDQIAGKYVLIGGDIADIDQFETPATRLTNQTTTGLEVHATLLAQLLDGKRFVMTPYWLVWAMALLVIACAAGTALLDVKPLVAGLLFVLQLALIVAVPFWLRSLGVDTQRIPAFGWAVGWIVTFSAVSAAARAVTSDQRRFAQSALGKYLPVDIANELLRNPDRLALHGEKREIYALFSDLEGFTKLSHAIEPEMVAFLLNSYLDRLSAVVLEHGGTIDKFVGDAVVAFWGAPIARPDDADRAARAAIAMYEAGEAFRAAAPPGVPPIGVTRVGVHRGEAIVGNFGGEGRMQYTALGDSMNLAARLEGANKQLKTKVLLSEPARARSTLTLFRPMGRVAVRGRSTPIAVWEPVPHMNPADVTAFTDMVNAFEQGDVQALQRLEDYANEHPDDAAVANLVYRLKQTGSGGSFVLD